MTRKRGAPSPGHWVTTRIHGRPVEVTTHYKDGRRLVLVRPLKSNGGK